MCVLSHFSCVRLFVTLWTVVRQDSLSMGFSRQEYCHGLLCFPPGDLPNPETEPAPLGSALAGGFLTHLGWCHLGSLPGVRASQNCPTHLGAIILDKQNIHRYSKQHVLVHRTLSTVFSEFG